MLFSVIPLGPSGHWARLARNKRSLFRGLIANNALQGRQSDKRPNPPSVAGPLRRTGSCGWVVKISVNQRNPRLNKKTEILFYLRRRFIWTILRVNRLKNSLRSHLCHNKKSVMKEAILTSRKGPPPGSSSSRPCRRFQRLQHIM